MQVLVRFGASWIRGAIVLGSCLFIGGILGGCGDSEPDSTPANPGDDDTQLQGDDDTQPSGDDDTGEAGDDDSQDQGADDSPTQGDDDSPTPMEEVTPTPHTHPNPYTPTPIPDPNATPTPQPELRCPEEMPLPDFDPDSWTKADPAPGGDIHRLLETSTPGLIYIGSSTNGLYVSEDFGRTWTPRPTPRTHIYSQLAVDPENPDRVAFSSGETFLSNDGGDTWLTLPVGDLQTADSVVGITFKSGKMFVIDGSSRVFRSEDEGASFVQMGSVLEDGSVPPEGRITSKVEEPPEGGGGEHQDTWQYWWLTVGPDGNLYTIQNYGDLYRSSDEGATWEVMHDGAFSYGTLQFVGEDLYVADPHTFFKSTDGGETMMILGYATPENEVTGLSVGADGTLVATSKQIVWIMQDGMTTEYQPDIVYEVEDVLLMTNGEILLGHEDGISRSDDMGETWELSNEGLVNKDLATVKTHPVCAEVVFVGSQCERGLYESSDWGEDLQHVSDPYMHYTMVIEVNPSKPWEVWITTDNKLYRSRDLGASWVQANPSDIEYHLHGLGIDPFNPDRILFGSVGSGIWEDDAGEVYRSEDGGETWEQSSTGLPDSTASIHVLHFSKETPGVVLLGSFRGGDISHNGDPGFGMYRSTDYGYNWTKVDLDYLSVLDVSQIEECNGRTYAATNGGVLSSDDDGISWEVRLESTEEFLTVACLGDLVLAADRYRQTYRSDNAGVDWYTWSEGLPVGDEGGQDYLADIAISSDGRLVYWAWHTFQLYMRPL